MQDPFEVRMRFIALLKGLNASQAAAHKAAQLALKHKDMLEDLHSCILEQLVEDNSTINSRANIICFVEAYMDAAKSENNEASIKMLQRDLVQVVHMVVRSGDQASVINVPLAKQVITNMHNKSLVPDDTFQDLIQYLAECEEQASAATAQHYNSLARMAEAPQNAFSNVSATPAPDALARRQVEQRVEEDRERHKRLRENIWAISEDEEVAKLWEAPAEFDDDDYRLMQEESEERYRSIIECPMHGRGAIKDFGDVKWTDGYVWPSPSPQPEVEETAEASTTAEAPAETPQPTDTPRFGKPPPRGPKGPHRGFQRSRGPKHQRGGKFSR